MYVVAERDLPAFSLGRLPDDAKGRGRAEDTAARLHAHLGGGRMGYGEAGHGLGINANSLRYGATTGTVLIRWEGARQPTVWTVPPPDVEPLAARLELARRYLHVFGPSTPGAFAVWAGISRRAAVTAFEALRPSLTAVRTPIGDAWILASDEPMLRADPGPAAPARLLPSGDAYFLLQGDERALLVPDADRRGMLWTPRVWPGAVLVDGEIRGNVAAGARHGHRSRPGAGSRRRHARRSRPRRRRCRSPGSAVGSSSAGSSHARAGGSQERQRPVWYGGEDRFGRSTGRGHHV